MMRGLRGESPRNYKRSDCACIIPLRVSTAAVSSPGTSHSSPAPCSRPGRQSPTRASVAKPVLLLLQQPTLISPDVHHGICALSALLHPARYASRNLPSSIQSPPVYGEPDGTTLKSERPSLCARVARFLQQLQPKHPRLQASHPRGPTGTDGGQSCATDVHSRQHLKPLPITPMPKEIDLQVQVSKPSSSSTVSPSQFDFLCFE